MKRFYLFLLSAITISLLMPSNAMAKKIVYGQYITYKGKVENGVPKGMGELLITNMNPNYKKDPALFKGVFDGNQFEGVGDFHSKGNYPSFDGKATLEIAEDGSSVKIRLISCSLEARVKETGLLFNERIKQEDNMTITLVPKEDGIHITSTPFEKEKKFSDKKDLEMMLGRLHFTRSNWYNRFREMANGNYAESIYENYFKNELNFSQYDIYQFYGKKNLSWNSYEMLKFLKEGITITLTENNKRQRIDYANNDYFIIEEPERSGSTNYSYRIAYHDDKHTGVIVKEKNDVAHFIDEKGNSYLVLKAGVINGDTFILKELSDMKVYEDGLDNEELYFFSGATADAALKALRRDSKGLFDLGVAFLNGDGVEANTYLGEIHIRQAGSQGCVEAIAYLPVLEAKKEQEKARLRAEQIAKSEREISIIKQRAIQNKDAGLAYDIAYAYENGGTHFRHSDIYFVQDDDSAMVWYKRDVAFGGDPTQSDRPNLYKAYKRIEQLRTIIEEKEKFLHKYTRKYGESAGTSLFKGRFAGLSFAAVNEFVRDLNSTENKYKLQAYEPSINDVIRYGRGVKNYTLFSVGNFAINLTEIKVLNGKVITQRNDYYGGMEQDIRTEKEFLDIYRDEGWIQRLDNIIK